MGTNCAPLVAYLFLYSYEAEFLQHLQRSKFKKQKTSFNLTLRYIDDVLDLHLELDEDEWSSNIVISSNIPESPAYGVFVSQLIHVRYARVVRNMKIFCSEDIFWF